MPSKKDNLLELLLDTVTQDLKTFVIFFVSLASIMLSTASVLVASAVCIVLKRIHMPMLTFAVIFTGGIAVAATWAWYGMNVHLLYYHNTCLWLSIVHGATTVVLKSPTLWLTATPYGVLLGGFMHLTTKKLSPIQQEAVSLLKEKTKEHTPYVLSQQQLQRRLSQCRRACDGDSTIIGVDRASGKPIALRDKDANLNTLVVGTTGSGKTTALKNLMESTIVRHIPLFYIDGKGDLSLASQLEHFASLQQVPFYRFSMLGHSDKYNPLGSGGFTAKKDRIIALREWTEPHYRKIAEGYLQTVFKVLTLANKAIDLSTLSHYCEPMPLGMLARSLNQPALSQEVQGLASKRKDIESLIAEIENIAHSELGHLFDCSSGKVLELQKAIAEKAVIYIGLQPLAFPSYAETLGKLFVNDVKSLLSEQLKDGAMAPCPLMILLDEFSVFAGEQIIHLINQGRSTGAHSVLSTQSLSDIVAKGGESLLGQVLNNVNNFLILRQNYHVDADILASLIGTCDTVNVSSQLSIDDGSFQGGGLARTKSYIIHPDEIKRLALGEAIFMNKARFLVHRVQLRQGRMV